MLKNYLKITVRNIFKYKGYSTLNILGLAIGMACCFLILFWVTDELNGDKFHKNGDRIYRVIISEELPGRPTGYWSVTPASLAEVMKNNYFEVEEYVRFKKINKVVVTVDNQSFREDDFIFADPSLFSVFSFPFIKGDPELSLKNPQSIVLTEAMAKKYFGDSNPIGKTLKIENKQLLTVSGIVETLPENSHISAKCIAHITQLKIFKIPLDNWGRYEFYTYLLLRPGANSQTLDKKIRGYIQTRSKESKITLHLQPMPRIYLYSFVDFGMSSGGDIRLVILLSVIASLILIIACINFINLSTARAANRTKEIGLRKVVGGQRKDLIFQFFGESNILAFIALLLALLLIDLLLPTFNQITGKQVDLEFILVPQILLGIIGITLFTGVISGIYPALLLSSFHPVKILKGLKTMGKGGPKIRKILVVTQFTLSIVMIICTMVIYQQLQYIKTKDLGFNKEQLAYLYVSNSPESSFLSIKNELTTLPGVLQVTAASTSLHRGLPSTSGVEWQGKNPKELVLFNFLSTDYNFLETLQIKMKSGRFFSKDMPTDINNAYIINEAGVKAMGISDPIGKSFNPHNPKGRIIGVIKDFNFRSLHTSIEPMFISQRENQLPYLLLRLAPGDQASTITSIKNIWEEFVPGFPFDFGFIDEKIDSYYQVERRMGKLFVYAAILAVVISCLGLFGLASFTANQKRKEIGIRKVLGAKIFSIIRLLSINFSRWVILANLVAWPIAYFFVNKLLQNYAYRVPLRFETFIAAGIISIVIALITVAYQTIRAAQTNPVNTLRHE